MVMPKLMGSNEYQFPDRVHEFLTKTGLMDRLSFLACNSVAFYGLGEMLAHLLYKGELESELKEAIVIKKLETLGEILLLSEKQARLLDSEIGQKSSFFLEEISLGENHEVDLDKKVEMELLALNCVMDSVLKTFLSLESRGSSRS